MKPDASKPQISSFIFTINKKKTNKQTNRLVNRELLVHYEQMQIAVEIYSVVCILQKENKIFACKYNFYVFSLMLGVIREE